MSFIPALLLFALYFLLRRRDRRMLRNGVVLVAACYLALIEIGNLLSRWVPGMSYVFLVVLALAPLAILALAATLLRNGAVMLKSEGRRLGNLLSLVAGLLLVALPPLALLLVLTMSPLGIGLAALLFFLCSYFGVVFVVFLAYAVVYGRMPFKESPQGIVVLGSRLVDGGVPPLLRSRLDKALEIYHRTTPRPLLIPSGGQGHDEPLPEGVAMADYLVGAGAARDDVAVEDKAVNTEENLMFSTKLFAEAGRSGPLLAVTNNYHVLRAALLARRLGIEAEVVGSPTAKYYLPSAFLREYVAVLVEHKWLHALLCLPFMGFTALLVMAVIANQG
ncbi:YdcF family protein [Paeniglutamicibacter sp. ABSL32-1]|uniref:YdcF family protein n=1 Tax=Paeniglutamicibacter quisquiliarum TaxID=2849498 RepID=UPI001C2D5C9C|nr:YdcF family protein [Paeniglutamicibacter quisquiliarum]